MVKIISAHLNIFGAAFIILSLLVVSPASVYAGHYKIGILAFQPESIAKAQWQPLATYLNKQIPQHTFDLLIVS